MQTALGWGDFYVERIFSRRHAVVAALVILRLRRNDPDNSDSIRDADAIRDRERVQVDAARDRPAFVRIERRQAGRRRDLGSADERITGRGSGPRPGRLLCRARFRNQRDQRTARQQ